MTTTMELATEIDTGVLVVTVPCEELDAQMARNFKEAFIELPNNHTNILLDLRDLRFIDSSGLGALLSCLRVQSSRGGTLKICCMTKTVQSMFELVRMHRIFEVFGTRDEAIRSFND